MRIELGKEFTDISIVVRDSAATLNFYRDTLRLDHIVDTPASGGATMRRRMCGTMLAIGCRP